jgi:hypothetical protein
MFLEALTSRFHVVFFGLLPRTGFAVEHLWTFDGPWRPGLRFSCSGGGGDHVGQPLPCEVTCHGCQLPDCPEGHAVSPALELTLVPEVHSNGA